MKRFIAALVALSVVLTGMTTMILADTSETAEAVTVTADESWQSATYDPVTGYLTNVTDDYYFGVTLNSSQRTFTLTGVTDYYISAPKVVIPYKFTYNGVEYTLGSISSYVLTAKKQSTTSYGIKELIISEGITAVGSSSFRTIGGLEKVKLPSTLKEIGANCFASSKSVKEINIPDGVEKIESGALQFLAITSITIPSSVKSFGGSMFYGCSKLAEVNLLFDYTTIPGTTFRSCSSLKNFKLKDDLTAIGSFAFSQTGFTEVVIPAGITSIEKQTFSVCKSLNSVTFKGEVTTIAGAAFQNCAALKTINFEGKTAPASIAADSFKGVKGASLVVNYPADGEGYDSEAWQALFPEGATFVRAQGEPIVKNLVLSGKNVTETTLTVSYEYSDPMNRPESGSVAVWEGCEEADFASSEVFPLETQECSAANPPSYVIRETDDGKYIRVTITPKNADTKLNTGAPVSTQLNEKVRLPKTAPAVVLTAPGDGYRVNCNTAVNMSAAVSLDNTTVTKVEFYANGAKVAEAAAEPYEAVWTPSEMGEYSITAKAYNALGEDGVSEPAVVTVLSEDAEIDAYINIEFTSPIADSITMSDTEVVFTGTAVESSGSEITSVEIYADGKTIHSSGSGEIQFSHKFAPGTYNISATAKSADGKTGYCAPFEITVSGMRFTKMMGDNMVLQRNRPVKLTGYGVDGTVVTAEICGKKASATVSGGMWQINLPALSTNKSTTLTFTASDGTSKTFNNVAIGEVMICSGQSNMTVTIGNQYSFASQNPYDGIRLFKTGSGSASSPQTDVAKGQWDVSTTAGIKAFSSVGYLTGYYYYLSQNGEVPVGLIQSAVSGTGINLWVPNDAYNYDPDLKAMRKTTTHYNYMIAPWTGYTIGHILWYQGESDSQHSKFYEKPLTAYIQSYREKFDDNLDFIIVQLPVYDAVKGYNSNFRHFWIVRESEYSVSQRMDRVGTAITIDTGSIGSVHPGGKNVVASRAALILQHFANPEQDIVWNSPNYDYHEIVGTKAIIHFKDVGEGLMTKDGLAPTAFKIAGDDMIFKDAGAVLVGNTVEIDISSVEGTPYIRYACEDVPGRLEGGGWNVNLVNSAGLPMAPFRTDSAKINYKSYDAETATYLNPYNFTPMIKNITADSIKVGSSLIEINARGFDDKVVKVELFIDGASVGNAVQSEENEDIWTYNWTEATEGEHSFYAIATDEFDLTSVVNDAGTASITPRNYVCTLAADNSEITVSYDETEGATAKTVLDGVLIIAAYTKDNMLVKTVIASDGAKTVSIPSSYLEAATEIKAFVFENLESIKPLGVCVTTAK